MKALNEQQSLSPCRCDMMSGPHLPILFAKSGSNGQSGSRCLKARAVGKPSSRLILSNDPILAFIFGT